MCNINTISFAKKKTEKGDPNSLSAETLQIMYNYLQRSKSDPDSKKVILELTKGQNQIEQLEILSKNYGDISEVMYKKIGKDIMGGYLWSGGSFISEALEEANNLFLQGGQQIPANKPNSDTNSGSNNAPIKKPSTGSNNVDINRPTTDVNRPSDADTGANGTGSGSSNSGNNNSSVNRPTTDVNRPSGADAGVNGTGNGSSNSGVNTGNNNSSVNRPTTDVNRPSDADTGLTPRTRYW